MKFTKRLSCLLLTAALLLTGLCTGTAAAGSELSQGQKNIVLRARRLMELQWTPVCDVAMWNGEGTYYAGTTYTGVPYSQPVGTGYLGYDISPEDFLETVQDSGSLFYTARSSYGGSGPYYGTDCSGFVSYAWDLPQRKYSATLPDVAVTLGEKSISVLEVGDCLNNLWSHAALVTDIVRNASGQVCSVTVMEQTDPLPHTTVYGEGGTLTLNDFVSRFFSSGYSILRYPERDSVSYMAPEKETGTLTDTAEETPAPVPEEEPAPAETVFTDVPADAWYYEAVVYAADAGLFKGTGETEFSPDGTMTRGMFITVLGRMAGISAVPGGRTAAAAGDDVNVRSGPDTDYPSVGRVNTGDVFSVLGEEGAWYRVSVQGKEGYIRKDYVNCYDGAFADLDESAYYAPYAEWAYLCGISRGTGSGFAADADITREDMAALLYHYTLAADVLLRETKPQDTFDDDDCIGADKRDAVYALQRAGVIGGMGDGNFAPSGSATRAQVAQIFLNFSNAAA